MIQDQPKPYIVPPCDKEIEILYQDDDLLLINKPDGLLSVPGRHPLNRDSVNGRLLELFPEMGMAHRLDLDTSGMMIVPLNKPTLASINKQFQDRKIHKTYTAVLFGIVKEDEGKVDLPLIFDWPNRPMQKVCQCSGKGALTLYKVLSRDEKANTTRVLFTPITGRSHQLRIHSREMGHPIIGCDMYASREAYEMGDRLMLHATEISFTHPTTGETMNQICAPLF
ncbi:MAG TPA: RNA pseudouridine synthase [Thiothrix sp.]|nr:RNA pseudouridine synthase [Thiothrix sp.]